jgi:hypothetical protein
VGISERFALNPTTSPGALVCPIPLDRNVLYVFVSEDAHDRTLALTDKPTGVHIPLARRVAGETGPSGAQRVTGGHRR